MNTESMTDNTCMEIWLRQYSDITPHYVISLEMSIVAPVLLTELKEPDEELFPGGVFKIVEYERQITEDFEDLQFGLATKSKYITLGLQEFTPHYDYQKERCDK